MGKVKEFAALNIRKITGGKDPLRVVEEFIIRHGFDPDKCQKEKTTDTVRWMIELEDDQQLEVLLEGIKTPNETTIYLGINSIAVPIRGSADVLAAALEIADGLVGIKVSLVGNFLVLSSTLAASSLSLDELEYHFKLITAQKTWFKETLSNELGWE